MIPADPMAELGPATIIRGDARALPLPDNSVDLIVTSPPYFALRSYQDGGQHYGGQIGSEPTPTEFIDALLECTAEMVRVLKPAGSIFVNLGDKYAGSAGSNNNGTGSSTLGHHKGGGGPHAEKLSAVRTPHRSIRADVPPKSLMGMPWRYALRCIDELGLILREDLIWSKPNGLPDSAADRAGRTHEYWFHFTTQPRYFSAVDEIRESHARLWEADGRNGRTGHGRGTGVMLARPGHPNGGIATTEPNPLGKKPGSVREVPSSPLKVPDHLDVDHFAAFPPAWPAWIIRGWSPGGICTVCEEGRRPVKGIDWSKVPHRMVEKRAHTRSEINEWCSEFADWCTSTDITRRALDDTCGTNGMGYWWTSPGHEHAIIPTPEQWAKIRERFNPPLDLDDLVHLTRVIPVAEIEDGSGHPVTGRHNRKAKSMSFGDYGTITGYACACPEPTADTRPAIVLDPFGGTGTTAMAARALGRHGITVDLSTDYCRLAQWRCTDLDQLRAVRGVPKADRPTVAGALTLFDGEAS